MEYSWEADKNVKKKRGDHCLNRRVGEWFPENRAGSRKSLAQSRNLGNVSTESRRFVFVLFGSEITWVSGSDFQTWVSVSGLLPDFTIRRPWYTGLTGNDVPDILI